MTMGRRLKRLRKDRRLTLVEASNGAGLSKSYVWDMENNKLPNPGANNILSIARSYGVSVEFVLEGADDPKFSNFEISSLFNRVSRLGASKQKRVIKIIKILLEA